MSYPKAFSHIGITVTDLDLAIRFYTEVLGFYHLLGPEEFDEERDRDTPIGRILSEAYGEGWQSIRVVRLATSNGIGIELQEFDAVEAETHEDGSGYPKVGVTHICVQDPDIEGLAERIVEHGGRQQTSVLEFYPNEKPFKLVYCEDPFGNIIEIDTHSFETTYSPVSYP